MSNILRYQLDNKCVVCGKETQEVPRIRRVTYEKRYKKLCESEVCLKIRRSTLAQERAKQFPYNKGKSSADLMYERWKAKKALETTRDEESP